MRIVKRGAFVLLCWALVAGSAPETPSTQPPIQDSNTPGPDEIVIDFAPGEFDIVTIEDGETFLGKVDRLIGEHLILTTQDGTEQRWERGKLISIYFLVGGLAPAAKYTQGAESGQDLVFLRSGEILGARVTAITNSEVLSSVGNFDRKDVYEIVFAATKPVGPGFIPAVEKPAEPVETPPGPASTPEALDKCPSVPAGSCWQGTFQSTVEFRDTNPNAGTFYNFETRYAAFERVHWVREISIELVLRQEFVKNPAVTEETIEETMEGLGVPEELREEFFTDYSPFGELCAESGFSVFSIEWLRYDMKLSEEDPEWITIIPNPLRVTGIMTRDMFPGGPFFGSVQIVPSECAQLLAELSAKWYKGSGRPLENGRYKFSLYGKIEKRDWPRRIIRHDEPPYQELLESTRYFIAPNSDALSVSGLMDMNVGFSRVYGETQGNSEVIAGKKYNSEVRLDLRRTESCPPPPSTQGPVSEGGPVEPSEEEECGALSKAWVEWYTEDMKRIVEEELRPAYRDFKRYELEVDFNIEAYRAAIAFCGITDVFSVSLLHVLKGEGKTGEALVAAIELTEKILSGDPTWLLPDGKGVDSALAGWSILKGLWEGWEAYIGSPDTLRAKIHSCSGQIPHGTYDAALAYIDNGEAMLEASKRMGYWMGVLQSSDLRRYFEGVKYHDACVACAEEQGGDPSSCPKPTFAFGRG